MQMPTLAFDTLVDFSAPSSGLLLLCKKKTFLLIILVPIVACCNAEFNVDGVAFVGLLIKEHGHKDTTCYVTYKQMGELLKRHKLVYHNMVDKLKSMHHPNIKKASKQQLKLLQSRNVLMKGASVAMLISLQSASRCCRLLGLPTPVCDQLAHPEAGMHLPAVHAEVVGPSVASPATAEVAQSRSITHIPAGYNYSQPSMQASIHTTIPKLQWDKDELKMPQFGLQTFKTTKAQLDMVQPQLELYREFRQEPVMMNRPQWLSRLQPGLSWESHWNGIMRFLGFAYYFAKVAFPMLNHYLNINTVVLYISYQLSRGMLPVNLAAIAHDARAVSEWVWSTQVPEQQKQLCLERYRQHQEQLENLGKQCCSNLAPDPQKVLHRLEQQQQRRQELSAPELMLIMYSLWLSAVKLLPYEALEAAEFVQVVLVLSFFFGFLPPQRESVVLSLQVPGTRCMHPACQHRDKCLGNHIREASDGSGKLELFVQHYKGSQQKGFKPLQVPLPPEVCVLYKAHLDAGRQLIIESAVGLDTPEAGVVQDYLFLWPSTLKPFLMAQVHRVFNKLVLADASVSFGVQWLRTVFIEYMRSAGSAASGLDEGAAARVMGHCLGVWDAAYDKLQHQRASTHVEQVMPKWRSQLLMQHKGGADLLKAGKQAMLDKGFKD